jgi:hypothetical protein
MVWLRLKQYQWDLALDSVLQGLAPSLGLGQVHAQCSQSKFIKRKVPESVWLWLIQLGSKTHHSTKHHWLAWPTHRLLPWNFETHQQKMKRSKPPWIKMRDLKKKVLETAKGIINDSPPGLTQIPHHEPLWPKGPVYFPSCSSSQWTASGRGPARAHSTISTR